jgi:tetratricopeptide (TPR) repeat protein
MAAERATNQPESPSDAQARGTISPAMRKRLQRCFERGKEVLRQEKPDHDYAHTMFAECVLNDPANLEYVEAMLGNLQRKYNNNKRGARLKGFGGRGGFKKAVAAEDWPEVFRQGLDLLKVNPWDVPTLRSLAYACQANHYNEVELRYLKNALDVNPKDLEVNRHCAESLGRMGQFDQAIACWHRIEELDKGNQEARRRISELTIAKTRGLPGLETTTGARGAGATPASTASTSAPGGKGTGSKGTGDSAVAGPGGPAAAPVSDSPPPVPSPSQKSEPSATSETADIESLERAVSRDESALESYVQLAEAYTHAARYREAIQTLKRALAASGGNNLAIREKLEDAQIRMVRSQVAIAEQRAAAEPTPQAQDLVKRFRAELNRQELLVLTQRTDRYPNDLHLKFELGVRLKREGNYFEARQAFEAARADPHLRAAATLEMGEAFQHLKQYGNAMKCYDVAVAEATQGSQTHLLALYRIGVLGAALKNLEAAAEALEQLIRLAPDYRDAADRLDKLRQIGDKERFH